MNFILEIITEKSHKIGNYFYHTVKLVIGDYENTLDLALGSWDINEYKLQWKEGLERLKTQNISCLVTCVQDLGNIPIIERWEMYRENEVVYFHRQIIVPPAAPIIGFSFPLSEFNRTNCYERIDPRVTNENGEAIDDHNNLLWELSIDYKAIEEFSNNLIIKIE